MGVCGSKQNSTKKNKKHDKPNPEKKIEGKIEEKLDLNNGNEIQEKKIENAKRNENLGKDEQKDYVSIEQNENMDEKKDDQKNFNTLKRNMLENVYEMHLNAIEEAVKKKQKEQFTHEDSEPEKRGPYYLVTSEGGYNI